MKPIDKAVALVRDIQTEPELIMMVSSREVAVWIMRANAIVAELDQMEEALQNSKIVDDEADAQHNTHPKGSHYEGEF